MFFGMCNSPATFQAMMDEIFKKEVEENLIIVYIDDILVFSKTIDGLKRIEQIILEKAREYDLYFKAKKCEFRKLKIKYLGLVVEEEGKLAMDPAKLKEYWTGLHQKQLKKYGPSLDLETFIVALSKDSPIWHIPFMIY
jgi:Reverse transcriptase (RNA-dependent DNA polymerase)